VRDRAILATLLYHGMLRVGDLRVAGPGPPERQGALRFPVKAKREKIRFVPMHAMAQRLIEEDLAPRRHGADKAGPVFRPVTKNRTGETRPAARSRFGLPQTSS
jgi:integrase/recombinase XerD